MEKLDPKKAWGADLIIEKRFEQIKSKKNFEYDAQKNTAGQLIGAANILSQPSIGHIHYVSPPLGWDIEEWKKLCDKPYEDRLAIAGSFMAAELDRLRGFTTGEFIHTMLMRMLEQKINDRRPGSGVGGSIIEVIFGRK